MQTWKLLVKIKSFVYLCLWITAIALQNNFGDILSRYAIIHVFLHTAVLLQGVGISWLDLLVELFENTLLLISFFLYVLCWSWFKQATGYSPFDTGLPFPKTMLYGLVLIDFWIVFASGCLFIIALIFVGLHPNGDRLSLYIRNTWFPEERKEPTQPVDIELCFVSSEPTEDQCSICLSPFDDTTVKSKVCGHLFHKDCIQEWIEHPNSTQQCPLCKSHLQPPTIVVV
ncbi:hypothetical protein EDD86DRAFT_198141 [Gorgonomyces haynaldii]|nr:hypothetical protein EDD86DRAFT_198141 [Gorgonomyces haynaldii]